MLARELRSTWSSIDFIRSRRRTGNSDYMVTEKLDHQTISALFGAAKTVYNLHCLAASWLVNLKFACVQFSHIK